ncbi:hypothetical protein RFI_34784, partial [Reticulomyxa filosa]
SSNQNEENKEEKKKEEVDLKNVQKMDKKTKRLYYCANLPTLVITPVNGRCLTTGSDLLNFLGGNRVQLAKKIQAHSISMNWRTVFVHFPVGTQPQELESIMEYFNKNIPKDGDEIITKCTIFQKTYVEQVKKKRQEEVKNPDINRTVLTKNVESHETITSIQQVLKNYGYNAVKVEHFKGLPVLKLTLSSGEE